MFTFNLPGRSGQDAAFGWFRARQLYENGNSGISFPALKSELNFSFTRLVTDYCQSSDCDFALTKRNVP
jgi:hypothetical protein